VILRPGLGATYRLQLHGAFGFADAAAAVPYLARLGVETLYLSPIAEAVPGSLHGYDGTDPTSLRAELGGEEGFETLVTACGQHGLGICVDHVPNHLATWHRGPWWRRLLAEGEGSDIAEVFDVDWDAGPPAARGRVALALLDRPLDDALTGGLVRLGTRGGEVVLLVGAPAEGDPTDLPLRPGSAPPDATTAPGAPGRRRAAELSEVLAAQHYRLVDWHDARERNYRRFFDIDGLVGVRVELERVFERTHRLLVKLASTGRVSALRVDHVDGLREPARYLERLREATGLPVVVEKILSGDERLPRGWPVVGTTGYETIDDVAGVLVDPHGLDRLVAAARAEGDEEVEPLTVECRRLVATTSFPGEVARVSQRLGVRPAAFREVAVRLDRYRTYLGEGQEGTGDGDPAELAVWRAAQEAAAAAPPQPAPGDDGAAAVTAALADPARRDAALRAQQLTGALMAKGVEDTAWYRLAGPLPLCEVGGAPDRARHDAVARFHDRAAERVRHGEHGLVPATTHDTKRAGDVRCRLYALSEMADDFEAGLRRLRDGLGGGGGAFDFETRVAAQLAVGVLPPLDAGSSGRRPRPSSPAPSPGDSSAPSLEQVAERLAEALRKGAREAKRRSSWTAPDDAYEERLRTLATTLLRDGASLLRASFGAVLDEALRLGALGSLSATVLRHAMPGVPDCFQGDETWNLSLVDPDNRRLVDLAALARQLDELDGSDGVGAALAADLRRSWRDGRVKQFVTTGCLRARRGGASAAFGPAAPYLPLAPDGPASGSLLCFARTTATDPFALSGDGRRSVARRGAWTVAVVTRLGGRLDAQGDDLPSGASYAGTTVALPASAPTRFVDALTGTRCSVRHDRLDVVEVLRSLPVALLWGVAT
jgi:(1->4)-alpha-D-glucan 1-alpha-D-glucosylmutase